MHEKNSLLMMCGHIVGHIPRELYYILYTQTKARYPAVLVETSSALGTSKE